MPTPQEHREWRRKVQADCPVKSTNKKLCRMRLCPCERLSRYWHDEWMKGKYGYFKAKTLMGLFEKMRRTNGLSKT